MSVMGVKKLRALCKLLLRANADGVNRDKLRGGLRERGSAVREANDLLALTKLRQSRAWQDNDELDRVVADIRRTAGDRRLGAEVRARALRRLAWIELGTPDLGADPTDDLLRQLVEQKPTQILSGHRALPEVANFDDVVLRAGGEHDRNI